LGGAVAVAIGVAAAGVEVEGQARIVAVMVATAAAAAALLMVMTAVRQWRFAPRRRLSELGVLLGSTTSITVAYPRVALEPGGVGLLVLTVSLVTALAVVWSIERSVARSTRRALGRPGHAEPAAATRSGAPNARSRRQYHQGGEPTRR